MPPVVSLHLFRPRRNLSSALYEGRDRERGDRDGLNFRFGVLDPLQRDLGFSRRACPYPTPGQGEGDVRVAYAFSYPFPPPLVRGRC